MAITNGYATLEEYKAWAKVDSSDSADDLVLEDLIEEASRDLDRGTARRFYASTETRNFDHPPQGRTLKLGTDLLSVTTLTNGDDVVIAASDYILLPANESPKYAIKLKQSSTVGWTLDSSGNSEQVIAVAGSWGYIATTPKDINIACMAIAKSQDQKRSGQNVGGTATITAAGVVISPEGFPRYAADVIRKYKRLS